MRKLTAWKKHKLTLVKDGEKSYVYVEDKKAGNLFGITIGMFAWHPKKRKYVFSEIK